jgi:hypothetical protein
MFDAAEKNLGGFKAKNDHSTIVGSLRLGDGDGSIIS